MDQYYIVDVKRILNNSSMPDVRSSFRRFTANFPDESAAPHVEPGLRCEIQRLLTEVKQSSERRF